jgi:hypothetical protein
MARVFSLRRRIRRGTARATKVLTPGSKKCIPEKEKGIPREGRKGESTSRAEWKVRVDFSPTIQRSEIQFCP